MSTQTAVRPAKLTTNDRLARMVLRCQAQSESRLQATWKQHFVDTERPSCLEEPDYATASAASLRWLSALAARPAAAFQALPACLSGLLESSYLEIVYEGQRAEGPVSVTHGAPPPGLRDSLGKMRDFVRDTGLAALGEVEGLPLSLLSVPLRASNAPRVLGALVCVRRGPAFGRSDASFLALVMGAISDLLEGTVAAPPRLRLSPSRRATRAVRVPVSGRAQAGPTPRQALTEASLFTADPREGPTAAGEAR